MPNATERPGPPALLPIYPEHERGRAKILAFRDRLLAEMAAEAEAGPAEAFMLPEPAPEG